MCLYMLPITRQFPGQAIYRCEHGSLHLAWDGNLLSFSEEDLQTLIVLIDRIESGAENAVAQKIQIYRRKAASGMPLVEIWIEQYGLRLNGRDFKKLRRMITEAADWLAVQPPFTAQDHIHTARIQQFIDLQFTRPLIFQN